MTTVMPADLGRCSNCGMPVPPSQQPFVRDGVVVTNCAVQDPSGCRFRPATHPGQSLTLTYALGVLGVPVVHRETIWALMPTLGERKTPANRKTRRNKLRDRLVYLENEGLIRRSSEWIQVLDPRALEALARRHFAGSFHPGLLDIQAAANAVRGSLTRLTDVNRGRREAELRALERLMRQAPMGGVRRSGRGSVHRVGPTGSGT
jgi:hypothetical protein